MSRVRVLAQRREGFSLVETVVAMLVGTVALISLAAVMVSTAAVQSVSLSRMELTSIGETKLDELRAFTALRSADTVQLAIGGDLTSNVANHWEQLTSARGRQYTLRWQVAAGLNGTRDVTLRVAPSAGAHNEVAYRDLRVLIASE
jgi:Tfp pilus assembly protein PilV